MDFVKKNKIIIGVVVIAIVAFLGVWYFVLGRSGSNTNSPVAEEEANIKSIAPEDIGLALELKPDGKAVILTLSKLSGIKTIEYELSYDAEETLEGETADVPKGVVGSDDVSGKSSFEREVLLGTCSANKCRYDVVKSDIKIVVKVI